MRHAELSRMTIDFIIPLHICMPWASGRAVSSFSSFIPLIFFCFILSSSSSSSVFSSLASSSSRVSFTLSLWFSPLFYYINYTFQIVARDSSVTLPNSKTLLFPFFSSQFSQSVIPFWQHLSLGFSRSILFYDSSSQISASGVGNIFLLFQLAYIYSCCCFNFLSTSLTYHTLPSPSFHAVILVILLFLHKKKNICKLIT